MRLSLLNSGEQDFDLMKIAELEVLELLACQACSTSLLPEGRCDRFELVIHIFAGLVEYLTEVSKSQKDRSPQVRMQNNEDFRMGIEDDCLNGLKTQFQPHELPE